MSSILIRITIYGTEKPVYIDEKTLTFSNSHSLLEFSSMNYDSEKRGVFVKTRDSEMMLCKLREQLSQMDDDTFFAYLGTSIAEIREKKVSCSDENMCL